MAVLGNSACSFTCLCDGHNRRSRRHLISFHQPCRRSEAGFLSSGEFPLKASHPSSVHRGGIGTSVRNGGVLCPSGEHTSYDASPVDLSNRLHIRSALRRGLESLAACSHPDANSSFALGRRGLGGTGIIRS